MRIENLSPERREKEEKGGEKRNSGDENRNREIIKRKLIEILGMGGKYFFNKRGGIGDVVRWWKRTCGEEDPRSNNLPWNFLSKNQVCRGFPILSLQNNFQRRREIYFKSGKTDNSTQKRGRGPALGWLETSRCQDDNFNLASGSARRRHNGASGGEEGGPLEKARKARLSTIETQ